MTRELLVLLANVSWQFALAVVVAFGILRSRRLGASGVRATVWLIVLLTPVPFVASMWLPAYVQLIRTPTQTAQFYAGVPPMPLPSILSSPAHAPDSARLDTNSVLPDRFAGAAPPGPTPRLDRQPRETHPLRSVPVGALLLWGWAAGAVVVLLRMGVASVRMWRFLERGSEPASEALRSVLDGLKRDLGWAGRVRLLTHKHVDNPFSLGFVRPTIVLPADLSEDDPQVRMILAHELMHVRRRDYLWNLLGRLSGAAVWFHPGFYLAYREYRLASEEVCDGWALRLSIRSRDYVECLMRFARRNAAATQIGFAEPKSLLGRRVQAVLRNDRGAHMLRKRSIVILTEPDSSRSH